ncbi:unnamed protein product [Protopolystoma xenopodis]|uniref:Sema domain-containing protein n=1 Tax=Protopolystoma xenopodis TaxID=117903 RepID=A0A448X0I9_9PLAT|nr:unnamed protein product [Protopolystoma xenopodis]
MLTHLLLVCVTVIHFLLYPLASPSTSSHSLHRPVHTHTSLAVCQLIHLPIDRLVGGCLLLARRPHQLRQLSQHGRHIMHAVCLFTRSRHTNNAQHSSMQAPSPSHSLHCCPVRFALNNGPQRTHSIVPPTRRRNINVCTGFDGRLYRLAGLDATSSLANGSELVSLLWHADSANQAAAENAFHQGHITYACELEKNVEPSALCSVT